MILEPLTGGWKGFEMNGKKRLDDFQSELREVKGDE
jgi:hypothetical protein